MAMENLPFSSFQTFFVSKEPSTNPNIAEMIQFSERINTIPWIRKCDGILSISYGKRILINRNQVNLSNMGSEDIVEIVDYDPVKNIVLAMGMEKPHHETPVHWLIQQARDDVHAVLFLDSTDLFDQFSKKLPVTAGEAPPGTIDLAKQVLRTLREGKLICVKNRGVLFVGFNLQEIEDSVQQQIEGIS